MLNSELLKNGPKFGKDYFDELLAKIKEIRASERRFYQKITDIYKECRNVVLIMIKTVRLHKNFIKMFKISCILQLQE